MHCAFKTKPRDPQPTPLIGRSGGQSDQSTFDQSTAPSQSRPPAPVSQSEPSVLSSRPRGLRTGRPPSPGKGEPVPRPSGPRAQPLVGGRVPAVTVLEPPDAVSAILGSSAAVRMRGRAEQLGSCSSGPGL